MKTFRTNATYCGGIVTAVSGPVGNVYTATIGADGGQVVEVTDAVTAVLVTDFVYHLGGNGDQHRAQEYLHCTAAEYAKWIRS